MTSLPKEFITTFEVYRAVKVLGEGGTGRVVQVTNEAGESFALKCLLPERVSDERRRRFKNEVNFCIHSRHQNINIVRVLDTGVAVLGSKQCPFYVMPLYDQTLRDVIARGLDHAGKIEQQGHCGTASG